VALVVDGRVVDTKPLRIVADPAVQFTDAARKRYYDIAMDLHEMQRRGTVTQASLTSLGREIEAAIPKVAASNAPADVKAQFATFVKDFTSVGAKFGVTVGPEGGGSLPPGATLSITQLDSALKAMTAAAAQPAGGGGRGGRGGGGGGRGGGGGPAANVDVLGRIGAVKGAIIGIWETPSDAVVRQYNEARAALPPAMAEANAFNARARTMSTTLSRHGVTMLPPR
jgi:hypothetical protein